MTCMHIDYVTCTKYPLVETRKFFLSVFCSYGFKKRQNLTTTEEGKNRLLCHEKSYVTNYDVTYILNEKYLKE